MRRARLQAVLVAALLIGWSIPGFAAGPAIIMIYGGPLRAPLFIVQKDLETYSALWCGRSTSIEGQQLGDRPYLKLAIFWLPDVWANPSMAADLLPTLKPEQAPQHGRLYLFTPSARASVVVTRAHVTAADSGRKTADGRTLLKIVGIPQPIPESDDAFTTGCWLTEEDVRVARVAGIPGL
jgi:hypothetical protein